MTNSSPRRISSFFLSFYHLLLPFAILLLFLALGDLVQSSLGTWIPGSVIGMLALLLILSTGVVRASFLDRISDWLLDRLGLFFVCPGVEIIRYLDLVGSHWGSLLVAIVGSSIVTLVVTGWLGEKIVNHEEHEEHEESTMNTWKGQTRW